MIRLETQDLGETNGGGSANLRGGMATWWGVHVFWEEMICWEVLSRCGRFLTPPKKKKTRRNQSWKNGHDQNNPSVIVLHWKIYEAYNFLQRFICTYSLYLSIWVQMGKDGRLWDSTSNILASYFGNDVLIQSHIITTLPTAIVFYPVTKTWNLKPFKEYWLPFVLGKVLISQE